MRKNPYDRILTGEPKEQHLNTVTKHKTKNKVVKGRTLQHTKN